MIAVSAPVRRDVLEQVVRELSDREDVDEVEEQLERCHDALHARRPRDGNPHRRDPTRAARRWGASGWSRLCRVAFGNEARVGALVAALLAGTLDVVLREETLVGEPAKAVFVGLGRDLH
jgi:hypothetical protein